MTETTQPPLLDGIDELTTAVFMALGGASTCWTPSTGDAVFDSVHASQIGEELVAWIEARREPLLGLATTRQLLTELETRMEMDRYGAEPDPQAPAAERVFAAWLRFLDTKTLDYRTVDS